MKKNLLLLIMLLFSGSLFAQDLIVKKNGEEIQAKVLEIAPAEVKYKRHDYQDGPTFTLYTKDLFMIRFENGTKQLFSQPQPAAATPQKQPGPASAGAPNASPLAPDQPGPVLAPESLKLDGPRVGVTVIGPGEIANELKDRFSAKPIISQFGWQFETRLFTADNGLSGLIEWVPLVGGLEQGLFLPSFSGLIGLRGKSGMELGIGPNLSVAGAGLVLAAGVSIQTDYVNLPINFAVVPSGKGTRFSLLTGFNLRKR